MTDNNPVTPGALQGTVYAGSDSIRFAEDFAAQQKADAEAGVTDAIPVT